MPALQLKPFFIRSVRSIRTIGILLTLLNGPPALSQLSFTPNSPTAGASDFNSGSTTPPSNPSTTTPQTNLTPIQSSNTFSNVNGGAFGNGPNMGNPSGAFDPYAINGQGTVPPIGSSSTTFGNPQTLPNGGFTTPNSGASGLSMGAAPSIQSNPSNSAIGTPSPSGQSNANPTQPSNTLLQGNRGGLFGLFSLPAASTAAYGNNRTLDNPSVYGPAGAAASPLNQPNPYGPSTYPNSIYPQNSPNSLFPDGLGSAYSGGFLQNPSTSYNDNRRLQGLRFRYTYVSPGSKPEHLGMNDLDASLAFAFPNFLNLNQPLYVIPSFSLHLWDGPDGVTTTSDLPSKVFDAFVDLGWESDPNKMVSTDFGLRLGVFSDFDTYTDRSFRVRGRALLNFRLTPVTSFKGGVYYVNRDELKLIPAVGLLYRPDPYTRIDLYFPKPKYARYYRTLGTYDLWWYLTGDYGGGNWTITRDSGIEESVDINDLRAIAGFEWGPSNALAAGRRSGFAEIGYVFNREVLYHTQQADNFDPDNAFMFRLGIGY